MDTSDKKTTHELKYKGFLKAHGGWVTSLAVGEELVGKDKVEFLLSGSRDRTLIKWQLVDKKDDDEDREWGRPKKMYTGKLNKNTLNSFQQATLTSSARSASPVTHATLSPLPGTVQSASGMLLPERLFHPSLDTLRMFSQLRSPPTTDKSSLVVLTTRSRSGTPAPSASTPLTRTNTLMPFPALSSITLPSPPSASLLPGTRPSKSGTTST